MPPGLDDRSALRHIISAIGRHRERLQRDGMTPPAGFSEFAAWLDAQERYARYTVEARQRALTRERVRRYRQRQREKRARAA